MFYITKEQIWPQLKYSTHMVYGKPNRRYMNISVKKQYVAQERISWFSAFIILLRCAAIEVNSSTLAGSVLSFSFPFVDCFDIPEVNKNLETFLSTWTEDSEKKKSCSKYNGLLSYMILFSKLNCFQWREQTLESISGPGLQ
ncbi:hypothetical protein K1719_046391 [Acacia pycnantha]|nr:hypothetical protein K1719_046391 [Acacia pycnantha]